MYRITGHYPMVVSVGRAAEQEAISYGSWTPGWWMPMSRPPAVTMMLPRRAIHDGSGKSSGRASGGASASRHTRMEPSPPAITGLLSRSTPMAIALEVAVPFLGCTSKL